MSNRKFPGLALLILCIAAAELEAGQRRIAGLSLPPGPNAPACDARESGLQVPDATRIAFADLARFDEVRTDLLERLGEKTGAQRNPSNYLYFLYELEDGVKKIWIAPSACRLNQSGGGLQYWVRADARIIDVEESM